MKGLIWLIMIVWIIVVVVILAIFNINKGDENDHYKDELS